MFKVNMHSLVMVFSHETKYKIKASLPFPEYEWITNESICRELVGEWPRFDISEKIFDELFSRTMLKLSLGERVVIDAYTLSENNRLELISSAYQNGAEIIILIQDTLSYDKKHQITKYSNSKFHYYNSDNFEIIKKNKTTLQTIHSQWNGITVVGDIHGNLPALNKSIAWAQSRNHYMVFLGDIIDYGSHSLEVSNIVYELIMTGKAEMIIGNHEKKIKRYLLQTDQRATIPLSDGNKITLDSINKLNDLERDRWIGRFVALTQRSFYHRTIGNIVFAHAGIHPNFWDRTASYKDIEKFCLFGNYVFSGPLKTNGKYDWIEYVPKDTIVIVGHEIQRTLCPLRMENANGGSVIFLDTGSGKGGQLSTVDLKINNNYFKIENFNMF